MVGNPLGGRLLGKPGRFGGTSFPSPQEEPMDQLPTTEEIVAALRTLGVAGPASAVDVLSAAGLPLPEETVAEVLGAFSVRPRVEVDSGGWISGPCT